MYSNRPFYSCVFSYLAMNASEAGGDLALIQTSLLFSFKWQRVSIMKLDLHSKTSEVCIKTRSPPASLPFKGLATKQATGKMGSCSCLLLWIVLTLVSLSDCCQWLILTDSGDLLAFQQEGKWFPLADKLL